MGLRANYSGTGWYKATDTGTVFSKDVPEGETHVFSDSPTEYISFYNPTDARLHAEKAAVSNIYNMEKLFENDTSFNEDISSWDVSNVTNMSAMFVNATSFNQDLSRWNLTLIYSLPAGLDVSATAWTLPRPIWGTSPRG